VRPSSLPGRLGKIARFGSIERQPPGREVEIRPAGMASEKEVHDDPMATFLTRIAARGCLYFPIAFPAHLP
jgi:hypothetical protein